MFCRICGKEIEGTSKFCPYCGAVGAAKKDSAGNKPAGSKLAENKLAENKPAGSKLAENKLAENKYERIFVEPDENYIGSLGNGYLNSFLTSRRINRCVALLSDKRVYLRGNMIDTNNSKLGRINRQQTVDLEDVTGTGFIYASPKVWQLILAGIMLLAFIILLLFHILSFVRDIKVVLIPLVLSIFSFVGYLKSRKTYFIIEYAGGSIKFDASIYGLAESQDFEKQIRRAKNRVKENK